MIKIKDCHITPKDIDILNSAVNEAFKEAYMDVEIHDIHWRCQILNIENSKIPVIVGQECNTKENPLNL